MNQMRRFDNEGLRKLCACRRRQWPKCDHPWHFNFRHRGTIYRFSLDVIARSRQQEPPRSKTKAMTWRDNLRTEIRAGAFVDPHAPQAPITVPTVPDGITFKDFGNAFLERAGETANNRACLSRLAAFALPEGGTLGDRPLSAITTDQLELFFAHLREQGRAASTRNKFVQFVKAAFRWGTKKSYLARNPVADADGLKREKHAKRSRRLTPDMLDAKGNVERDGEERRLLAAAGPYLRRLIIAAVETTKTDKTRHLPISSRLAGVLEMAHATLEAFLATTDAVKLTDQERAALIARCHVFGDETGAKVGNFKRGWETCIQKAHGHVPEWAGSNGLKPASRAALATIDLHFHDLRHEAGSRLLEAGVPLHHV